MSDISTVGDSLYSENVRPIVAAVLALDDTEFRELLGALRTMQGDLTVAKRRNLNEGDEVQWLSKRLKGRAVGRVVRKGPKNATVRALTLNGVDIPPHEMRVPFALLEPVIHTKAEAETDAGDEPPLGEGGSVVIIPGLTADAS